MKPLEGITVLDFSQFLSGPSAGLRLADLGAKVIKVEKPDGDICRTLYNSKLKIDNDSALFHSINRNKDGITIDLKKEKGRKQIKKLIKIADIMIINFRPGVSKKLGLDYETVNKINPKIIYGEVTGYGKVGPWSLLPGQDLLAQSLSGLTYLSGNKDQIPTPTGISIADMSAGQHLVQGILAGLIQREITGVGTLIEVSLLESVIDIALGEFTTFLNDNNNLPKRSSINNAHVYMNAPYGIYETKDSFIALGTISVPVLGELLGCEELKKYVDKKEWITKRDEIKEIVAKHLKTNTTKYWLKILDKYNAIEVYTWERLVNEPAFKELNMIQEINIQNGQSMKTLRCPITIDGQRFYSNKPAPKIGQDNKTYIKE